MQVVHSNEVAQMRPAWGLSRNGFVVEKGNKKQNNKTHSKKHITRTNRIQKNHHQTSEKRSQDNTERWREIQIEKDRNLL